MAASGVSSSALVLLLGLVLLSCSSGAQARLSFARRRLAFHRRLQANTTSSYCAKEAPGAPGKWKVAQSTCLQFFTPPSTPLKAPADTATVKYGQILGLSAPFRFYDRAGKFYSLGPSAVGPANASEVEKVWSHILVKAELTAGTVTRVTPVLYVPSSTVLLPFKGSVYEGTLHNGPFTAGQAPEGVNATAYIRFSFFGSSFTADGLLPGTFDNLYRGVRDTSGKCRPALCTDSTRRSAACAYYSKLFNATVHLTWDAQVYYPGVSGSQLGIFLSSSSYVPTYLPPLYQLTTNAFVYVPGSYAFNIGNPFGLPYQISGTVAKAKSAKVPYC